MYAYNKSSFKIESKEKRERPWGEIHTAGRILSSWLMFIKTKWHLSVSLFSFFQLIILRWTKTNADRICIVWFMYPFDWSIFIDQKYVMHTSNMSLFSPFSREQMSLTIHSSSTWKEFCRSWTFAFITSHVKSTRERERDRRRPCLVKCLITYLALLLSFK